MWLMYYGTKKECYRLTGERSEELLDATLEDFDNLYHNVGFMWHISAGANYKITGNKKSRTRAMYAASSLASRYNMKGKYIRARNDWPDESQIGSAIIDCMLNIPLLYWASEECNDSRFKYIAMSHADTYQIKVPVSASSFMRVRAGKKSYYNIEISANDKVMELDGFVPQWTKEGYCSIKFELIK